MHTMDENFILINTKENDVDTKEKMVDSIFKRDFDRKEEIEKKKKEKISNNAEHEQIEYFCKEFDAKKNEIEEALEFTKQVKLQELPAHFDNINKQIHLLQKFVSASLLFLNNYNVRKCQETLNNLISLAHEQEEIYLPKKKFSFKNKKQPAKIILNPTKKEFSYDLIDGEISKITEKNTNGFKNTIKKVDLNLDEYFYGFKQRTNEKLILKEEEILKKDVILERLENCIIILFGTPSTLHMNNLSNCIVMCGPVSTSIFIENCQNSKLVLACQQLRLHSSKYCDIYLHVTSKAIMEDCNEIHVAPYNFAYHNLAADFQKAGLDSTVNNWNNVDDFNWLANKQSPNWSILSENNRITNWESIINSQLI